MKQLDFYLMNTLIKAIDAATLEEINHNIETCVEMQNNPIFSRTKELWKEMASFLRKQKKKY